MITKVYYVEDPADGNFCHAMEYLEMKIPCFIELIDLNTVYVECREEDLKTVEKMFAPYV